MHYFIIKNRTRQQGMSYAVHNSYKNESDFIQENDYLYGRTSQSSWKVRIACIYYVIQTDTGC